MATLLASPAVDVRSSTNCPASQDVAERLRPLLPDRTAQGAAPDVATVDLVEARGTDTVLRLRLVRADHAEVGDREVLVQGDCAEAAATLAAVIAAWETEPIAPPPRSVPVAIATPASATPTPPAWQVLVGAGGGVGLVGGVAGVGRIEALAGKSASRAQGRVGFTGETMRTDKLSTGSVAWRHTTFDLGVAVRTLHPVWSLSVDAGLALGWATLEGREFSPPRQQRSLDLGGVAALRLGRSIGGWWVWAEARAYGWARVQRASLTGDSSTFELPPGDVTGSLGLLIPLF
jgi:hypothetical protein